MCPYVSLNYIETNSIEVVLVPNTVTFDAEDPNATEVTSEYLYDFVLDKLEKIDDQEDLYNELLNEIEQAALEESQNNQTDNNQDATNE